MYLKLDKKLIVRVSDLKFRSETADTEKIDKDKFIKNMEMINELFGLFQEISIERFNINDYRGTFVLDKENVYLDSKHFNLAAKPSVSGNSLFFNVYSLYIKDYSVLLEGNVAYDLKRDVAQYKGSYYYKEVSGSLSLFADEQIDFLIDTKKIENIHFVKDFARLDKTIEAWMYDNVPGIYRLYYLTGKLDRKTLMPIPGSIEGSARVEKAKVHFNEKVDHVDTEYVDVTYSNDTLSFELKSPKYRGKDLTGSSVNIYNIAQGEKSYIDINILTKGQIDTDIKELLKGYDIELPIEQSKGTTDAKVYIRVMFADMSTEVHGEFNSQKGSFELGELKFDAKDVKVLLDNKKVNVINAVVDYDDMLNAKISLDIDLFTDTIEGRAVINDFELSKGKDEEIVRISALETPVFVDIKKDVNLTLDELGLNLCFKKEDYTIKADDLGKLYDHSKLLKDLNITKGNFTALVKDANDIQFNAKINNIVVPIAQSREFYSINGSVKDSTVKVRTDDERVMLDYTEGMIGLKLKNVVFELDSMSSNENIKSDINAQIKDSVVILSKERSIRLDSIDYLKKASYEKMDIKKGNNTVFYEKDKNSVIRFTSVLDDNFVNSYFKKNILDGTGLVIKAEGTKELLKGRADLSEGKIKNLSTLNNLISAVNASPLFLNPIFAIPSIISAVKDGFSTNGYKINEGKIHFLYNVKKDFLNMEKINIVGAVTDINGRALVDIENDNINGDLSLSVLKNYSELLKNIPMVNHILLGKDKRFDVGVKLNGKLMDPEVNVNVVKDVASESVGVIKRVIESPFILLQEIFGGDSNESGKSENSDEY